MTRGHGPMLDEDGIRRLRAAGVTIGAHTVDHPILANLDDATARAQIQQSRERLIDAALQSKSERYVSEIFDRLRDVSVAARANKPIGDRMILNAAFLVSRDSEDAFDARVKALGATHDKLTFKYTGPWPPYNFVNIRLKLERA